jgi:Ca2+-binding RTX toxin-like protein
VDFSFGTDIIGGGDGADTISVADGITDIVVCGDGEDTVYADTGDKLQDCENVFRTASEEPV